MLSTNAGLGTVASSAEREKNVVLNKLAASVADLHMPGMALRKLKTESCRLSRKAVASLVMDLRPARGARANMAEALRHLKERGFTPRTVIDVGVARGTDDLYEAFPDAKHLLIEPLGEF